MVILFLSLLLCAAVFLIILVLNIKEGPTLEKEKKVEAKEGGKEDALGSEVEKLITKLKGAREELTALQEEMALAKRNEADAREELSKLTVGIEKDKGAQENYKKEISELKNKLVEKDAEYEKEFSLNLNLNKALSECTQKCNALESANREYAEKLRLLEARTKAYQEELKKQNQIINELNKRNEENQWVSKKEYDELKERLSKEREGGSSKG